MKTLAIIKNELFKDFLKIVSTDNLEKTLDNPAVPLPFTCLDSVQNDNSDALAQKLNDFFIHRKLKNKDFLSIPDDELATLNFMVELVKLSSNQVSQNNNIDFSDDLSHMKKDFNLPIVEQYSRVEIPVIQNTVDTVVITAEPVSDTINEFVESISKIEIITPEVAQIIVEPMSQIEEEITLEDLPNIDSILESTDTSVSVEIIDSLNIPKNSIIHFGKNDTITALLVDDKTVVYEDETISIIDATKRAFKKSGATGMALGLANWNFEGISLKVFKDKVQ
jgi:hypothetical protein